MQVGVAQELGRGEVWGEGVSLAGEAGIPFLVPRRVLSCLVPNREGVELQ